MRGISQAAMTAPTSTSTRPSQLTPWASNAEVSGRVITPRP